MNLLPKTEKEKLKKGLKYRLLVIISFLVSAAFFAGFIMLLPSYFLTLGYFSKDAPASPYWGEESEDEAKEILNLPDEIDLKLKFFQSKIQSASAVDHIYKIIDFLPEEVTLNSVSFSRKAVDFKDKSGIPILISGVAFDRNSLVSFSTELGDSDLFSSVEVPVSSLTKDRNLPFSINLLIKN